jgi:hypothetical protein
MNFESNETATTFWLNQKKATQSKPASFILIIIQTARLHLTLLAAFKLSDATAVYTSNTNRFYIQKFILADKIISTTSFANIRNNAKIHN